MSNLTHGMSIGEIEAIGKRLQQQYAADLRSSVHQIDQMVDGSCGLWIGPDADRFRSWWPAKRAKMLAIVEDLHGYGQSALNNVTEQRDASDTGATTLLQTPGGSAPDPAQPGGSTPPAGGEVTAPRTWQEVQQRYDAWATGRFAAGGESHYQCTGWANFRWQELGYTGIVGGHGGAMADNAPGETSGTPTLHAMASYGAGVEGNFGHVMIVEEVRADGAIRVSEMNTDGNPYVAGPQEYSDDRWITKSADGTYRSRSGQVIRFAAFPG